MLLIEAKHHPNYADAISLERTPFCPGIPKWSSSSRSDDPGMDPIRGPRSDCFACPAAYPGSIVMQGDIVVLKGRMSTGGGLSAQHRLLSGSGDPLDNRACRCRGNCTGALHGSFLDVMFGTPTLDRRCLRPVRRWSSYR